MVHKMLELHKKKKAREAEKPPQIPLEDPAQYQPRKGMGHVQVNGHKVKVSVDESPYTIGAFAPLIDSGRFNKPLEEFGEDWEADERRKSKASYHSRTHSSPDPPATLLGDLNPTDTFSANGLLGNTYALRKQAQLEEERQRLASQGSSSSIFAPDGQPTLLNGGLTSRSQGYDSTLSSPEKKISAERGWFPSALEHTAKQRSEQQRRPGSRPSVSSGASSQHEHRHSGSGTFGLQRRATTSSRQTHTHPHPAQPQPQPLVTCAPTFVEAPQWSREGRGRGVKAPEGKPLVDFATGPPIQPDSRFTPAVPPQNLIRRSTQREVRRPPPLAQRRATESDEARPVLPRPLISPTGTTTGSGSGLPTRRPTVTSTTSRSRRADPYGAPPVSPTSPTTLVDPRTFPRGNNNNNREDRPGTRGSSPGGGVYGYAAPEAQASPPQTRARGYSRSASGPQQQGQVRGQQQAYSAPPPPRYLNSRGDPRSAPPVVPPAAATGALRDPRELLLLQKRREREREREERDMDGGRDLQRAPQPLGQRAPLRYMGNGDGYGRS